MARPIPWQGIVIGVTLLVPLVLKPWMFVFWLLMVQCALISVLIFVPVPAVKTLIARGLRWLCGTQSGSMIIVVIGVGLVAQGGVSFYRQNNFMKLHEEARQGEVLEPADTRMKMYREQRNMYMCIFTFFCGVILYGYDREIFRAESARVQGDQKVKKLEEELKEYRAKAKALS